MSNTFTSSGRISIIMDGQFGSTGKGLIAAHIASINDFGIAISTASPNSGHTFSYNGEKRVVNHLPVAGVINPNSLIYLNAGSVIDLDLLRKEVKDNDIDPSRVYIHNRAAVISEDDKAAEKDKSSSTTKLASTQKGVGSALASKILRVVGKTYGEVYETGGLEFVPVDHSLLNDMLMVNNSAILEIPQGFSLGLNSGLSYPYCTSKEVSVAQGLSDCGVHPRRLGKVMMTFRTYPIRVGNIMDGDKVIGWSGPGYQDQNELSWEDLGVEPELTTVTKRPRRVFEFSMEQYKAAIEINRPDYVFLNFVNYLKDFNQFKEMLLKLAHVKAVTHYGVEWDTVVNTWEKASEAMGWTTN